ncbi:SusC/RagA family TonB-linked outer membrane protein [Hymenobacter sp. 15J16-1T3B]|uniref:SusC/RagA family TonB-linked outer membrane protein n=1 Tax=Hymenobacter sp. 15J16-1T3B TaxID=2886941 RepID=UPI001D11AFA7|nr:SusC/RagA family TonB-linked outer membrane protein [Hymenobacter sp. 15J16-1T3B]MCC3157544.1 SusC/RagA family TonB-linked outer membrane protein [Hymenobacter sp. 15J16-1T3B]
MTKLLWSLALPGLVLAQPALAQQTRTVTGTVTAAADRAPLPGVNVVVKGGTTGTQTGPDGRFSLQVPEGATLVFSFIGYGSVERAVGADNTFDVALTADAKSLDEVVVTAFGIKQERREVNYAAQQVTSKDIIESRQPNVVNALQGKVAGVQITSAGGAPGEGASIVIRGGSSLDGNNQPLFVIDGIIMDNSSFVESTAPGGGSGFNGVLGRSTASQNRAGDLNPEDIASITVLKGPAAAALYGLRAGNGAIIITTKKGQSGRTSISYRTQFSVDEVSRLPKLQNQYKQGTGGIFDPTTRLSFGPRFGADETVYNNVEDFFQKGHAWQHYLTMSGGSEKATFLVSASRVDQTGVAPTSQYDKSTVRLSGTVQFSPKISASGSAQYLNSGGRTPLQGPGLFGGTGGYLVSLLSWPRNDDARVYLNPDGTRRRLLGAATAATDADNPYFTVYKNPQTARTNRMIGNAQLTYAPAQWLSLSYNLGTDFYNEKDRSVRAVGTSQPNNQNGGVGETQILSRLVNSNFLATFKRQFGEDFGVTFLYGNTIEAGKRETTDNLGLIFQNPDFVSINNTVNRNTIITTSERRIIGNFARLNLDLFRQLTLEVQGRYDRTSTLPNGDKIYGKGFPYGSVAAGWEFTRTLGLDQNPVLNYGKLRASFADVGKDTEPYRILSPLAQSTYIGGGFRNGFFGSNPRLKPEHQRGVEIGLDLQFLQNRLGLDLNVYRQRTNDQIIGPRVSQAAGFILQYINGGTVENKGIEVALTGSPVKTSNGFSWDVLANFTLNRNKAISLPYPLTEVYQSDAFVIDVARGGAFPGRPLSGISGIDFKRTPSGALLIDASGYPVVNTNVYSYIGDRAPRFTTQITNTFAYKGLSLAFLFDFRKGGLVVNGNDWFATRQGLSERTVDRYKQVVFDGEVLGADGNYSPNTKQVELTQGYYTTILGGTAQAFVEDASWTRLRYATLTYAIPTSLLGKTGSVIKGVELSVTGRNLLLLTKYSGVDPEVAAAGAGVRGGGSNGFDFGSVPGTRGVDMALRVNF